MIPCVLIVGAGIGGLTLAQVLTAQGQSVVVIEKVPAWRTVGAGLILSGNAMRVLDRLGLSGNVHKVGHPLISAQLATAAGRPLQTLSYAASGGALGVHRSALQAILGQGLERKVRFGTTLRTLQSHSDGVHVTLSDGSAQTFDAVIGADGLHSSVRQRLFGNVRLRYAGYTSWRFLVSSPSPAHATELWGRGCRLGVVPVGKAQTYGYITANAPEGHSGHAQGGAAEMLAHCAGFGGPATKVLAELQPDTPVVRTDIHEVRLRRWVSGRVGLLGDAAHAMTPNLGQGAAMSMEDAWVLGQQLRRSTDVPAALAQYEALRHRRVSQVQTASRLLGLAGQLESSGLRAMRDMGMRVVPAAFSQHSSRRLFQVELETEQRVGT